MCLHHSFPLHHTPHIPHSASALEALLQHLSSFDRYESVTQAYHDAYTSENWRLWPLVEESRSYSQRRISLIASFDEGRRFENPSRRPSMDNPIRDMSGRPPLPTRIPADEPSPSKTAKRFVQAPPSKWGEDVSEKSGLTFFQVLFSEGGEQDKAVATVVEAIRGNPMAPCPAQGG